MYYINAISTISHQDSFRNTNLFRDMVVLDSEAELIAPNYKEMISGGALRRLSPILRMGLATSIDCKNQVGSDFDSIVVGTALGCLKDTEKFLVTFNSFSGEFLPPTSFIQSTHNTIGGQISLALKNHSYNMTHTQNNLSFEVSLLDAMMCVDEGKTNVLVGSADETVPFLEKVQPDLIPSGYPLSSCASFFALSPDDNESGIGVNKV
jgi:3-oxoacyl-[acyl-carrier-protein] synthase II